MKAWQKLTVSSFILIVMVSLFAAYGPKSKNTNNIISVSPTPLASVLSASDPNAVCHIKGDLPDPNCTPGTIDPSVTQDNIDQTICVSGYTKTVRPSATYTNKLKAQQVASYGYQDINLHDYEEDHLISLELGGAPSDPNNLWPEPGASPNYKDKIENICHKMVCSRQITLITAQQQIATNWHTACQ